jgi:hypothetical protein
MSHNSLALFKVPGDGFAKHVPEANRGWGSVASSQNAPAWTEFANPPACEIARLGRYRTLETAAAFNRTLEGCEVIS